MPDISEQVRALYEEYPYPPRIPGDAEDPYIDYILNFSSVKREGPITVLDAGCGTGSGTLGAAIFHKDIQVYGCDFNSKALEAIQKDVDSLGLDNVELRQVNLLDFPMDWGPEGGFDVIFCTGVIHHTPDPLKILQSLASRLAPQGIMHLMVYSAKGRSDLYRFARTARYLASQHPGTLQERVAICRHLMSELHHNGQSQGMSHPSLRGLFEGSHLLDDEEFVDRYLHPHDVPYDMPTLMSHLGQAGLQFLRWFEERDWDLYSLLPAFAESGHLPEDPLVRFGMVEELFDRLNYDLFAVGPDFEPNLQILDWDCPLRINPQVNLSETKFRSFTRAYSAKLLYHPEEDLSLEAGKILQAVTGEPVSLREIVKDWGEEETEEILQLARYLQYREYLYRAVSYVGEGSSRSG